MIKLIPFNLPLEIVGHGRAVPPRQVSNLELLRNTPLFSGKADAYLEKVEERMIQGFGFKKRHMIRLPYEPLNRTLMTTEDLGFQSAQQALQNIKIQPEILIHGTTTTSRYTGSQATAIAGRLGMTIPAYETKAGCSTGLASLHMAYSFLSSGYDSALCVFAETLSKVIDTANPEAWFGLADGGATLFLKKSTPDRSHFQMLKSVYFTDGEHINLYSTQGQLPPLQEEMQNGGYVLKGDAEALRIQALRRYSDLLKNLLTEDEKKNIRWIMGHQVNRQLIRDVIEMNQLVGEPFWINHEYGNIGGTTIPFSLSLALEKQTFKKGDLILLMSVGGGVSAAAQLWRWN